MKDRKTIVDKANEKIINLLTEEPTDKFQRRIQESLNSSLNEEAEFALGEKSSGMNDEEVYKHFDTIFTDVIDKLIAMITAEISYCEEYDYEYPVSLDEIKFADIGMADWFKIITDIHTKNLEKKLGFYRFSVKNKADLDKILDDIRKTILSEE